MEDPTNLANRTPGQAAQEQADALRAARRPLARILGIRSADERAWAVGAQGERRVAAELAAFTRRRPGWFVLHAVPIGDRGSDIDHVLIGPAGVFTINAKHHPGGRVWVKGDGVVINGQRVPYVRNSRHEAARAARLLSAATQQPVEAMGLVVTVGADLEVKKQPADVWVGTRRGLRHYLKRQPAELTPAEVAVLYEAACRPESWRSS